MREQYINQMLDALKANIEYLKKTGNSSIRVKQGELIGNVGELYLYEFKLDFFQNIDTDTDIEVRVNGSSTNGKVVAVNENDGTVQVQLENNLGSSISEATLIISSYYLLQLLVDKLEAVKNGDVKLTSISEKVFGLEDARKENNDYVQPASGLTLNPYQSDALKLTTDSEVSYIWGPPGTGKTATIASIIEAFIKMGLSTLLISHTNQATDNALLKAVKHLKDTDDYQEGRFLREGKIQNKELAKYKVVPEVILKEKAEPIMNELEKVKAKIIAFSSEHSKLNQAVIDFKKVAEAQKNIKGLKSYIGDKKAEIKENKEKISTLKIELKDTEEKINRFQNSR